MGTVTTALLLSGGMDSIALAYWKRPDVAITVDYGQAPAKAEVQASRAVCATLGIKHEVIEVDCSSLGSGDLAGTRPLDLAPVSEWWPFRNQLLITLSAAKALAYGCNSMILGAVAGDSSHADGTPDFITKLSAAMEMQEGGLRIEAPAINLSAVELIKSSGVPIEVLAWSHSCHTSNFACGFCRGCGKHFATTKALGFVPY